MHHMNLTTEARASIALDGEVRPAVITLGRRYYHAETLATGFLITIGKTIATMRADDGTMRFWPIGKLRLGSPRKRVAQVIAPGDAELARRAAACGLTLAQAREAMKDK
jgi:hypothetical protein